jgi:hypothetical protein
LSEAGYDKQAKMQAKALHPEGWNMEPLRRDCATSFLC